MARQSRARDRKPPAEQITVPGPETAKSLARKTGPIRPPPGFFFFGCRRPERIFMPREHSMYAWAHIFSRLSGPNCSLPCPARMYLSIRNFFCPAAGQGRARDRFRSSRRQTGCSFHSCPWPAIARRLIPWMEQNPPQFQIQPQFWWEGPTKPFFPLSRDSSTGRIAAPQNSIVTTFTNHPRLHRLRRRRRSGTFWVHPRVSSSHNSRPLAGFRSSPVSVAQPESTAQLIGRPPLNP